MKSRHSREHWQPHAKLTLAPMSPLRIWPLNSKKNGTLTEGGGDRNKVKTMRSSMPPRPRVQDMDNGYTVKWFSIRV